MSSTALEAELDFWQPAGCAVRIEYSRAVMEELRLAATDGFNRLAHGGVEIGGVLFGVRDSDAVKILAHRALACEYAFGPSFTLWDNDRRALEDLLASPNTDTSLSGMQPVGWYHSHTRSEILLSEKDLQLFQRFFPEIWQIALVLRPYSFDPVRAGFFFRRPDGSVQAASSHLEFIIKPVGGKPGIAVPGDGAPADTAPAPAVSALLEPALPEPAIPELALPEPALPEPALTETGSQNRAPYPPPGAISRNLRSEPLPEPKPRDAASYPRRRWGMSAAVSAAAIAVVVAGALFWIGRSGASAGLSLRARDVGGQLRIDWNRNSPVIQQSGSGVLEIEDGSGKVHEELSQEHLRAGSITYLRTTGNVLVRLLVRGTDQSTFTETSRFLVPPVATAAPIDVGSADRSTADRSTADRSAPDRSAKKDGTEAALVPQEPAREVQQVQPVESPSNRTPPEVRIKSETARQIPAASVPARRLVLPHAAVPLPAVPLMPAPPAIAANTASAMPTVIPRLPAPAPPNPAGHPADHPADRPADRPADQGPSAGKIIWTGKLARSGTIQILGNRASQGHITGGLPGGPVRVHVFPSELTQEGLRIFTADPRWISRPEAPGAQNGWNRTDYVLNPKKAGEIGILEAPGQQNAWNRLVLRAERGDHSIIVLRWERVPAESAIHAAGSR